jgi:hypothetical protein
VILFNLTCTRTGTAPVSGAGLKRHCRIAAALGRQPHLIQRLNN